MEQTELDALCRYCRELKSHPLYEKLFAYYKQMIIEQWVLEPDNDRRNILWCHLDAIRQFDDHIAGLSKRLLSDG